MTDPMGPELNALRLFFSFGMPGGRTAYQKAIGRYLDGEDHALDTRPAIKAHIDQALEALSALDPPE